MLLNIILRLSYFTGISSILKKKPTMGDLLSLLAGIEYEWHKIGVALEVEQRVLAGCTNSNGSNYMKLYNVIENWITTMALKATWETIISAVEGPIVKHKSTAVKIRMFLANPQVYLKYEQMKGFS